MVGPCWLSILYIVVVSVGEGNGSPLQYSCLENPVDRGALVGCCPYGRTESDTTECARALEKEMAAHSSILVWRIPGTEEPGGRLSMGSQSWTRLKQLSSSSSSSKMTLEVTQKNQSFWVVLF